MMKKKFYIIFSIILSWIHTVHWVNNGLLDGVQDGIDSAESMSALEKIRTGNLHTEDIPNIINGLINIFIWVAGTVSVVFVIVGAYQLLFGSLSQDHTKWRTTIVMALTGFGISVLAWFIVQFLFDNFTV